MNLEKYDKQTRKRNQWYFEMKAHVEVDSQTKQLHSVATAANVHDSQKLGELLHGERPGCGEIRPMWVRAK